jgi:hypothetical protein
LSTYSDHLIEPERAHVAPVHVGAGPFWVEHCEEFAVEKLREKGLKEGGSERRRSDGGERIHASGREGVSRRGGGEQGVRGRQGDSGGVVQQLNAEDSLVRGWALGKSGFVCGWTASKVVCSPQRAASSTLELEVQTRFRPLSGPVIGPTVLRHACRACRTEPTSQ